MKVALTINTFFVILFIAGSSCKKDKQQHTTAKGMVVDATTQQPIPNALVQLLASKRGLFSFGFGLVDTIRSDADGKYNISFEANEEFSYFLQPFAKKHIDLYVPTGIDSGEKNKLNLPLQPEGFLRINIVNIPPLDTIQHMSLTVITLFPLSPPPFRLTGSKTIKGQVWGNTENRVIYLITKRGIQTRYETKVFYQAHDTTTFTIEY